MFMLSGDVASDEESEQKSYYIVRKQIGKGGKATKTWKKGIDFILDKHEIIGSDPYQQNWNGRAVLFRSYYRAFADEGNGSEDPWLEKFRATNGISGTPSLSGTIRTWQKTLGTILQTGGRNWSQSITYIRGRTNELHWPGFHGPCDRKDSWAGHWARNMDVETPVMESWLGMICRNLRSNRNGLPSFILQRGTVTPRIKWGTNLFNFSIKKINVYWSRRKCWGQTLFSGKRGFFQKKTDF